MKEDHGRCSRSHSNSLDNSFSVLATSNHRHRWGSPTMWGDEAEFYTLWLAGGPSNIELPRDERVECGKVHVVEVILERATGFEPATKSWDECRLLPDLPALCFS